MQTNDLAVEREYLWNKLVQNYLKDLPELPELLSWLKTTDFFTGPSSTKWHNSYAGGNFDHIYGVTKTLLWLTERGICHWQRPESPVIIGMFHDTTKFNCYKAHQDMNPLTNEIEMFYTYNSDCERLSNIHGEDSLLKLKRHLQLTEEEELCIRYHMGAYEGKEAWPEYDAAIKKYPNVLWTHTADMYSSKVLEVWK